MSKKYLRAKIGKKFRVAKPEVTKTFCRRNGIDELTNYFLSDFDLASFMLVVRITILNEI